MGLTLLAAASLPIKFWGEAFTTATYLINILPSPVLHNKSPHLLLFHTAPNYTLLKTFGCACYPLLRPYNKHKLDFKSAFSHLLILKLIMPAILELDGYHDGKMLLFWIGIS